MRIVLINQYAGGPSLGMEFRPHWMASRWQERGHDVLVVCGDHSHLRNHPRIARGMGEYDNVSYLSLPTTPYRANGPARFLNLLSFSAGLRAATPRLERFKPDVVIASSTHPFDVRPAYRLARRTGAAFVFEVHDLWPLTPILLGGMSEKHPAIVLMRRDEAFAYRHADLVISLLPKTEEYMRSRGLSEGRWVWIPNGVSESDPPSQPSDGLRALREGIQRLRQRYPHVLIYAGGHGVSNALEDLLAHATWAEHEGIGIVLVGSGPLKDDLVSRYGESPNVAFFDPVPRTEVAAAVQLADFAYAGAAPSPLYSYGISFNKIYDYMAARVPIIENIGAANSPVLDADAGLVADPTSPDSLRDALRRITTTSATQLGAWGENGQTFVETNMRQNTLADQMLHALSDASDRL